MVAFCSFNLRVLLVLLLGNVPQSYSSATWRGLNPPSNIPLSPSFARGGDLQRLNNNPPINIYNNQHSQKSSNNGVVNNNQRPLPPPPAQEQQQSPLDGPVFAATSNNGVLAGLLSGTGNFTQGEEPMAIPIPQSIRTPQASTFLYRNQNFTEEMFLIYSPGEKAVYQITKVSVTPQGVLSDRAPAPILPRPVGNPPQQPQPPLNPSRPVNDRKPPSRPSNDRRPLPFRPLFDDDDRRPPPSNRPLPFDIIDTRGLDPATPAPPRGNDGRLPPFNPGPQKPRFLTTQRPLRDERQRDEPIRPPKRYFQLRVIVEGRK